MIHFLVQHTKIDSFTSGSLSRSLSWHFSRAISQFIMLLLSFSCHLFHSISQFMISLLSFYQSTYNVSSIRLLLSLLVISLILSVSSSCPSLSFSHLLFLYILSLFFRFVNFCMIKVYTETFINSLVNKSVPTFVSSILNILTRYARKHKGELRHGGCGVFLVQEIK